MSENSKIDQLDQLLPQTQCGLCDYDGCRPYAAALTEKNERIDACLPGGVETLLALATALNQDATPLIDQMQEKTKEGSVAKIREDECIGCTKCIQACPTDAIIGASKKMHVVLTDACTGCELCVEPCPVDCIDMLPVSPPSPIEKKENAKQWRERYQRRNQRLAQIKQTHAKTHEKAKLSNTPQSTLTARKQAIADAVRRAKEKNQRS